MPEPAYSHKPITTNILFKNEIAQIFQRKCFQCHSENNLSMSLTTYTEARPWARAIREEVLERKMPPWQAVPGYGHFANDISLNTREKEIILSWADGGAPSGVLKAEESIPPVFVPPAPGMGSRHARPGLAGRQRASNVPSGAAFEIKRFVVATKLAAAETCPGHRAETGRPSRCAHAAFYDERNRQVARRLDAVADAVDARRRHGTRVARARRRLRVEIGYSGAGEGRHRHERARPLLRRRRTARLPTLDVIRGARLSPLARRRDRPARARARRRWRARHKVLALWPNPRRRRAIG